jgi:hypothetical protein
VRWHDNRRQASGIALLAVTAVTGIFLAVHGWSGRHSGVAPGALAGAGSSSAAVARPSPPTASASSSVPTAAPRASGASPTARPGPLLASQSYARYAFRVWPGTPSAAGRAALTGLSIAVHRQGSGLSVTAGVSGQHTPAPRFFPQGARVYVIEASLGDDSGNSDYSLGDDGLVVTNAQGEILQ